MDAAAAARHDRLVGEIETLLTAQEIDRDALEAKNVALTSHLAEKGFRIMLPLLPHPQRSVLTDTRILINEMAGSIDPVATARVRAVMRRWWRENPLLPVWPPCLQSGTMPTWRGASN